MTRPAAVDALFAGHTLPKSKAALDEVREHIRGLERIARAAPYVLSECDRYRCGCGVDIRKDEELEEMREALQALGDDA